MADSWLGQLLLGSGVGPSIIYLALSIAAGMFPSTTGTRPVLVVKARALGNTINYKLLGL